MTRLTFTRAEWTAIATRIATGDPLTVPPGLAEQVDALLRATPSSWPDEPCVLDLEPADAAAVTLLNAQGRRVTEAERVLHDHQQGNPTAAHRIEHRSGGVASVVAYLADASTLQEQLGRHAARLRAAGASGEIVLIEQESLAELARLPLLSEPDAKAPPA